jgi:hypothetical protein
MNLSVQNVESSAATAAALDAQETALAWETAEIIKAERAKHANTLEQKLEEQKLETQARIAKALEAQETKLALEAAEIIKTHNKQYEVKQREFEDKMLELNRQCQEQARLLALQTDLQRQAPETEQPLKRPFGQERAIVATDAARQEWQRIMHSQLSMQRQEYTRETHSLCEKHQAEQIAQQQQHECALRALQEKAIVYDKKLQEQEVLIMSERR